MNSLITQIQLSETQITNECLLKKDEKILESSFEDESNDKSESEIMNLNKKKNFELVRALEKILQLSISSSSENKDSDSSFAFHVQLSVVDSTHCSLFKKMSSESSQRQNSSNLIDSFVMSDIENKDSEASTESMSCEACDQKIENERFETFDNEKIISIFHKTFAVS